MPNVIFLYIYVIELNKFFDLYHYIQINNGVFFLIQIQTQLNQEKIEIYKFHK